MTQRKAWILEPFTNLLFSFLTGMILERSYSFNVYSDQLEVTIQENEPTYLSCKYSADFGTPQVEWKFISQLGSNTRIYYDNHLSEFYKDRAEVVHSGIHFKNTLRVDTGTYICEVFSGGNYGNVKITLTIQVPPSIPTCQVPTSVTTGGPMELSCFDPDGFPPSTYKWYKDKILIPENGKDHPAFQNSSFSIDHNTGILTFNSISMMDSGEYYCEAANGIGHPQSCATVHMEVSEYKCQFIAITD
nr:PREDICTED: junctional adhesion molecule A-like [Latimeria chalumnae]|eukprot:XP_006012916.1 PREDICTED: junctional adhesion molecule A-like [Latimeria chalumnae]